MAWLVRVALSISDELKNARNSSLRYLISEAKNIVRDEYADADLSLDTVCSKLGVSNSYFSSIFKKEVGISFITYLTDYRMQQAVHLMLETNEKIMKLQNMLAMRTQTILDMFLNANMECRLQNIAQSIWENEYEKKKSVRYSVCHYDGSFFDDGNYVYIYGVIALQSI